MTHDYPDVRYDRLGAVPLAFEAVEPTSRGSGGAAVPPSDAEPVDRLVGRRRASASISIREFEVLACRARGLGIKRTAQVLGVSAQTVKNHTYRVLAHLNVQSVQEALFTLGWVRIPEPLAVPPSPTPLMPPLPDGWTAACMTSKEWADWQRLNPIGLTLREVAQRPCEDCPRSYAREMRALGQCNGEPLGDVA